MSIDKDIEAYVLTELKTRNTIYEPTVGDVMCFYTPHGVYGPVPYESNAYYSTFSTQEKIVNSNAKASAEACIVKIQEKINIAKQEVASAANNELSFVHVRFYGLRTRICRSFVLVSADVCVACSYKHIGFLDALFDFG
jgi:hypothetical protein